jgi:hypothetical protein
MWASRPRTSAIAFDADWMISGYRVSRAMRSRYTSR